MRHRKREFKIGSTASYRRCMIANMLKSLIEHGRIETTVTKAKELRRHADKMVTLAKRGTLASRRQAASALMLRYNRLTPKEQREVKNGNTSSYNTDRQVLGKLDELATRFAERAGGYTRIIKSSERRGDNAERCLIEYLTS